MKKVILTPPSPSFLGNLGIAYQGTLSYTLSAFSGNFSQWNSLPQNNFNDLNMVILGTYKVWCLFLIIYKGIV